jgi:phenylacetate-CoA ligase
MNNQDNINSQNMALELFHEVAEKVPAYKDFLRRHKVKKELVKTFSDLRNVPYTDKNNYINFYPVEKLVWPKSNTSPAIVSSSSGTSGEPNFWLTSLEEVNYGYEVHKLLFNNFLEFERKKTLIIINFAMGTWIAGIFTFLSTYSYLVNNKNNCVSIATPGLNKNDTLRLLNKMANFYDQILFIGYPTFIKEILDVYMAKSSFNGKIKFIFAGEPITESWREYLLSMTKSSNHLSDAISIYGSADGALMGFETPQTIAIRKQFSNNLNLNKEVFGSTRVPTIVTYMPNKVNFMVENSELLLTTSRSLPLVRYNLHDKGGILTGQMLKDTNIDSDIKKSIESYPHIYIFGRDIFSVTLYAAFIYPENIKNFVMDKRIVEKITGKYLLKTEYDKNQNNYLDLKIELKDGVLPKDISKRLLKKVFAEVVSKGNSEYSHILNEYGKKAYPKIKLIRYETAEFSNTQSYKKSS